MDRREALKAFGTALSLPILEPLFSTELLALGREAQARLQSHDDEGRYIFRALDPHQNRTVAEVAEIIIPETDTPGARAARVNEFIDLILAEWYPDEDKERFLKGLVEVDEKSRELSGVNFIDCDEAQRMQILEAQEEEAVASRSRLSRQEIRERFSAQNIGESHFFDFMKWLTLWGYYTSEVGMKEEIHLRRAHPSYQGCVLLESR